MKNDMGRWPEVIGVLTWPNGYDADAIRLHSEMTAAGELTATAA